MSSNNNTPRLRFPGFEGEWVEKTICDIADVLQGYGFPEKYQGKKNGNMPFYKVGDISSAVDKGNVIIYQAANYIDYSLLSTLHAKPIPVGATVFAKIGEAIRTNKKIRTGVPCLIDNNAAAVKAKTDGIDEFLFYLMCLINLSDYSGGVVPSVNKSTIEAIPIYIPQTISEKQKIASCLTKMDNLIYAQGQRVEALKEKKKGLMQQLFPQPGETSPQLRFPGFTGEWEEKKLGEIGDTYGGLSGKSKDDFDDGNSKFITFMNVLNNVIINTEILGSVKIKENEHQNKVRFGDMLFNTSSETPEEVGFCAVFLSNLDNVYLNSFCFGYRFNSINDYLPLFLAYYFRSDCGRELMHRLAQGITRFNLSKSHFNKASIAFPPLPEQQKIALCLSSLDDLIAAESEKLEALKSHKKGLMQQLFPQPEK